MQVLLSLGSNMGNSKEILSLAISDLSAHNKIELIKRSSFYKTKPIGFLDQDDFYNLCLLIDTKLEALELLRFTQSLEYKYKRIRTIKDGPRTLDIDIIAIEGLTLNSDILTIPHSKMHERAFVLIPACEICKDFYIEGKGSIESLAQKLDHDDILGVRREN